MTRLPRWAARLYPPAWRARYGDELDALIEDAGAGWRDLGDVLKGAFRMHITGRSFVAVTAVCGALGVAAAAAIAFHMPDSYVSSAVLRLGPGLGSDRAAGLFRVQRRVLSRSTLARIIQTAGLYQEERQKQPLEDIVQEMMRRHIQIVLLRGNGAPADAIQIRFSDHDRAKAQAVTRELAQSFILDGPPSILMADRTAVVSLELLDPASLPQRPSEPNRPAWIVAGLAIGLAVGLVVASGRRWPAVVFCAIGGAMLAGAISYAIPNRWVATAVVAVRPPEAVPQVMDYVRQSGGGIQVQTVPTRPGALIVQSGNRNPALAQAAVRQFVADLIAHSGRGIVEVEVLDPAHSDRPASPNRLAIVLAGLAAGLLSGGVWQRLRAPAFR